MKKYSVACLMLIIVLIAVASCQNEAGNLYWYKHDGYTDGSQTWTYNDPRLVGTGWGDFKQIFSGGNGVIYATIGAPE